LEVDGALDVGRLLRPDEVELRLATYEAVEPVDERGDVRAAPAEPHHGLLQHEGPPPEGRERGRAEMDQVAAEAGVELGRELTGRGLHPRDPQGGPDGRAAGRARGVRGRRDLKRE